MVTGKTVQSSYHYKFLSLVKPFSSSAINKRCIQALQNTATQVEKLVYLCKLKKTHSWKTSLERRL